MASSASRSEVQRFNGEGDFSLWTIRMMAHFGVSGLKEVVLSDNFEIEVPLTKEEGKKVADDDGEKSGGSQTKTILDLIKLEKDERAKDMIILNISNQVLRKIKHCTTAASMWSLLERLYMSKSLPNRIFVQSQFYTFKCDGSKTIEVNVDEFLKIVAEMSSLNVSVTDEIQAIMFLNSLPMSYDQLKHTLKYGKESLTLKEVCSAARSKQREVKEMSKAEKGSATILYTDDRGRNSRRDRGIHVVVIGIEVNQRQGRWCAGTVRRRDM